MTQRSLTEIPIEEAEFEIAQSKQCLLENGIEDAGHLTFVNRYSIMGWSHDADRINEALDEP